MSMNKQLINKIRKHKKQKVIKIYKMEEDINQQILKQRASRNSGRRPKWTYIRPERARSESDRSKSDKKQPDAVGIVVEAKIKMEDRKFFQPHINYSVDDYLRKKWVNADIGIMYKKGT